MKDDRNREIIEAFKAGSSIGKIGTNYGISRQRVAQILKNNGIQARVNNSIFIRIVARNEKIIADYKQGLNLEALADKYGSTTVAITEVLKTAGVYQYKNSKLEIIDDKFTCRKCGECKPVESYSKNKQLAIGICIYCKTCETEILKDTVLRSPLTPEVVQARKSGMALKDIAAKYDLSICRVSQMIRFGGGEIRRYQAKRDYSHSKAKQFNQQLKQEFEAGATLEDLASKHGISKVGVYKRLNRAGVKMSLGRKGRKAA